MKPFRNLSFEQATKPEGQLYQQKKMQINLKRALQNKTDSPKNRSIVTARRNLVNNKFTLLLIGTLLHLNLFAQVANRNYMGYTQTCHYTGTLEEYAVVQIFGDTTLTVSLYTSSSLDQYTSVTRNQVFGKSVVSGDTISVIVDSTSVEKRFKIARRNIAKKNLRDGLLTPPELRFVLTESGILWLDHSGIKLKSVTPILAFQKEIDFFSLTQTPLTYDKTLIRQTDEYLKNQE